MDDRERLGEEGDQVRCSAAVYVLSVVSVLANSQNPAQEAESPTLSSPVSHTFVPVLKFFYRVWVYTPPVSLGDIPTGSASTTTPEGALASLADLSRQGKYPDWLALWDAPSQERIKADRHQFKLSDAEFLHAQPYAKAGVRIQSFVVRGGYVVLRFTADEKTYSAAAFKQAPGGWLATREIDIEVEAIANGKYDPVGVAGL
jgi:hypothetical protein